MLSTVTSLFQQAREYISPSESNFTPLLDPSICDGGLEEFERDFVDKGILLGEGEFGKGTLIQTRTVEPSRDGDEDAPVETKAKSTAVFACKTLHKGAVFKDNVLYSPLKPEALITEVECLRALNGEHFCLKLQGVYESSQFIRIITQVAAQGHLSEYFSQQDTINIRTLSLLAFQLFDAVRHCATKGIIHRDIKPQNCLIVTDEAFHSKPQLSLIDFGSSTIHKGFQNADGNKDLPIHNTYAGSAFYCSPEMFQKTYTQKTDVWSAGVVLYVCAAGFPNNDDQQIIFNALIMAQKHARDKQRDWKTTLKLGVDNDALIDLLDASLTYRHKQRPNAASLVECDPFLQLWKETEEE